MKIYIVTHFYDNGESYEDYREYEYYYMFSTDAKAYAFYCEQILSDYEGRYSLIEWELDTQKRVLIEESPWVNCTSEWDRMCEENAREQETEWEPPYLDPADSIYDYWKWEDMGNYEYSPEEEDRIVLEYLNTPHTNYKEWQECNKEIQERKNAILLEDLSNLLNGIC